MDESDVKNSRRAPRSSVLFAATIQIGGQLVPVKLRNLSQEGALVEADRLPVEGDTTCFQRNDLRLKAQVVWVQGRYAGVAFDERLNPEQVLRHVPKPKTRSQVRFMRPGLACRPLTDRERRMVERWMAPLR